MDGPTIVGISGAFAAIASAIYAGWQARAAKTQATAANAQVAVMNRQVEEAKRANALTEQMIKEEREARRFRLKLSARPVKERNDWYLVLRVENNCAQTASIQNIAIVFGDGTRWTRGCCDGQIDTSQRTSGLIGLLQHGQYFTYQFGRDVLRDPDDPLYMDSSFTAPDYGEGCWRNIDCIEVEANNEKFTLTGLETDQQPPLWKSQFQSYPTRSS